MADIVATSRSTTDKKSVADPIYINRKMLVTLN